ncbi:MAG: protein-L-isoaspartate O-methyltransferase [Gemmatimonadetes bacterium RIFCSPLOWO2_02_FULL_71_11]|nr:MAG: protein-L-isoaspartate O-methyltransferase [Gemmatimonadetes bacterium RIFCSPLOWO2_02_FULL_71_11]
MAVELPAQEPPALTAFTARRLAMVEVIAARGVADSATLGALRAVPRHEFVPAERRRDAYGDFPLPIGFGQTISQPYIVGYMTAVLRPRPGMRVLEVGTGSGYQAAVLAAIGCEVFTIEIFEALAGSALERLARLGYDRVSVRHGDGFDGWSDAAPFDAVIVTAAAGFIPPPLVDQLRPGGRMIIPVGTVYGVQYLVLVEKAASGEVHTRQLLPVRFVPLLSGLR